MKVCKVDECGRKMHARGFCSRHYSTHIRRPGVVISKPTTLERFWSRVEKTDACWLWIGTHLPHGYGQFNVGMRHVYAHRYSYELHVGPIPDGLQIDHLCRVRDCVNPDHLEAVSPRTNAIRSFSVSGVNARKTHCVRGHAFDEQNTYPYMKNGHEQRACRTCRRENNRLAAARKRDAT